MTAPQNNQNQNVNQNADRPLTNHGPALAVVVVLFILFAVVAALFGGIGSASKPTGDNGSNKSQPGLYVDLSKVPADYCVKLLEKQGIKVKTLSDGSKTPIIEAGSSSRAKLYSDGTAPPLKPQNLEAVQASICHYADEAAMVDNGLGRQDFDGKNVAKSNPWMVAQGSPSTISPWGQHCLTDNLDTHNQCVKVMSATAYMLGYFQNRGVGKYHTIWNYSAPVPRVGGVPEFVLNTSSKTQYTGFFVAIQYTMKTGTSCVKYGFNVGKATPNGGDQRLARLACQVPTKTPPGKTSVPPKSSAPPPHGTTPASPPSTTHRVPVCTSGPAKGQPVSGQPYGVCPSGKHVTDEPTPTGGPVKTCPGGYLGRDGQCHSGSYTPTPSPTPSTPSHSGTGPTLPAPTEPPVTPTPIASSPTASGTVPPHGP